MVFRGAADKTLTPFGRAQSRVREWQALDKLFQTRGEVSSALFTIAGYVVSRGYITLPASEDSKAREAKDLCDSYAFDNDLDNTILDGTINLCLHGTDFLENNLVGSKLVGTRNFPWQEQIQPNQVQKDGQVKTWKQVVGNRDGTKWKQGEIIPITLPPRDADGYGSSLVNPIRGALAIRQQLDLDIKDYIHKSALPKEIFSAGDQTEQVDKKTADDLYAKVKAWKPGDQIVVNYPVVYKATGVGPVESRMFPEIIRVVRDSAVDGLLVPPISYQRSSTEASSRAMMGNMRIAIVQPIQRLWKRAVERGIFKPLLLGEGYDDETISEFLPRITFMPPTEEELDLRTSRIIRAYTADGRVGNVEPIVTKDEARVGLDMPPMTAEQQTAASQSVVQPVKKEPPEPVEETVTKRKHRKRYVIDEQVVTDAP